MGYGNEDCTAIEYVIRAPQMLRCSNLVALVSFAGLSRFLMMASALKEASRDLKIET